jgi:Major Facilitator Superfamily.
MFSKFLYLTSISSYLIFYLMQRFHIVTQEAQMHLFIFLAAVAAGTLMGGPIGDRIGRKKVIWVSLLGIAPFTLALPYVGLTLSAILTMIIGFSAGFGLPSHCGVRARIGARQGRDHFRSVFRPGFWIGRSGCRIAGGAGRHLGYPVVYQICAFLPLLGVLAAFLPHIPSVRKQAT